jgi:hypothetical protein
MTTEQAIAQSIQQNEIVTIDYSVEAEDELNAACDDSCVNHTRTEYWGEDDGSEWRVHLRHVYSMIYTVEIAGSPWDQNVEEDDVWTGEDFDTLGAAAMAYDEALKNVAEYGGHFVLLSECIGDGTRGKLLQESKIPGKRKRVHDDGDWRREHAHQAGMMHGAEAYNEAMGWD